MKPIEPPDFHYLSAAVGWVELGLWREAVEELEKITPEQRNHPLVLRTWYEVYAKGEKWDRAARLAQELVQVQPQDAQGWVWQAYATRRMAGGGIPQAREILEQARKLIPDEPLIAYNLGCYECQLGHMEKAWSWLEQAFTSRNPNTFREMALQDRDLEPLWGKIKGD